NKNKGIIISVSTNAVLPNFIEKVKNLVGKIDTIQISIDGLNEVYNSIRINSNFKLLDNNIKALTSLCTNSSTDLMLNMVVTKDNYRHMPEVVKYADKVGIKYLDFTLFNLASVTSYSLDYYKFYESKKFLDVVSELEKVIENTKKIQVTERYFKTDNSFQKCPYSWSHFYISQDGYVPPCCAKPFPKEKNFGNVFNASLIDILNSNEFRKWRELWFNNRTPDFCKKCHFVNIKPIEGKQTANN
ncbi:MAG: SPASM domain-containing protein, partial [Flavobacteriaceae bacterium]|nr:SPASM domain-containing protein [Flavobacteriaceae bacterium]